MHYAVMTKRSFRMVFGLLLGLAWSFPSDAAPLSRADLEKEYYSASFRAVGRDAFPVLHNPSMGSVKEGDRVLRPAEWVIGIAVSGEARAYPITVMGFHELANDRVGGLPITVCW